MPPVFSVQSSKNSLVKRSHKHEERVTDMPMAFTRIPQKDVDLEGDERRPAFFASELDNDETNVPVLSLFNNQDDIEVIKSNAQSHHILCDDKEATGPGDELSVKGSSRTKYPPQEQIHDGTKFIASNWCFQDGEMNKPNSPTVSVCSTSSSTSTLQNGNDTTHSLPSLLDHTARNSSSIDYESDSSAYLSCKVDNALRTDTVNELVKCNGMEQDLCECGVKNNIESSTCTCNIPGQSPAEYSHSLLESNESLGKHHMIESSRLCKHNSVESIEADSHNVTSSNRPSVVPTSKGDITICLSEANGRLSTVLENIPLVYIPHTRQLTTVNQNMLPLATPLCAMHSSPAKKQSRNVESTAVHRSPLHCPSPPRMGVASDDLNLGVHLTDQQEYASLLSSEGAISPGGNSTKSENSPLLNSSGTDSCIKHSLTEPILDLEKAFAETMIVSLDTDSAFEPSPHNSLQRTATIGSLSRTDASSFSSISSISTNTDFSINASISDEYNLELRGSGYGLDADEETFMEVNLHSRNSYEHKSDSVAEVDSVDLKCGKPKRKGITSFFTRGLFSRKPKTTENQGWRLFGKVPPKNSVLKDPQQITEEYHAKLKEQDVVKKNDVEVSSTTALILENRPKNLPSKCPDEESRHRQEYAAMIEAAKKKEVKEAKLKKKQMQQQLKVENELTSAAKCWNNDILPHWDTMKDSKRARDLWWKGIPPNVRGKVWQLAIGNDLNITHELYEICLTRAKDKIKMMAECTDNDAHSEPNINKEDSVELIKLDISRTFPQLCIFQKGGPYYDLLHSLLGAYACYRPDVGYVQGMSFIAAVLLLNMDVADAFVCFANLLNKPCQVAFFRIDESIMKCYFDVFEDFFAENLPKLYNHFKEHDLTPDIYIIDWIFTLFSKSLPLDVASRVWDVFCRDGEEFLFRTALGILKVYEEVLLNLDFIHLAQFLTKLSEDISADQLFKSIDSIQMIIDKKRFVQVLANNRDKAKDSKDTLSVRSFKDTSSVRSLVTS